MSNALIQQRLFNFEEPQEPKKKINKLSEEDKIIRQEQKDSHISWKLYKSRKFDHLLTDKDKYLLKKYYGITL